MSARPTHYNTRYKFDLSPRQREVLELIERGRTNAEIAESLGVSLDGAKYHVREILAKLEVTSREDAAAYWRAYNRPTAKLGRALSGVFGLGTLKAVVGGVAVIGAGGVLAGAIIAINASRDSGSGDEPAATVPPDATPSVTPTPSASPTPSGAETPEDFARRIAGLISAGEIDELLALSDPVTFTCPGPTPQGAGGPFPLCDGAAPGEERQGYVVLPDLSEASTVSPGAFPAAVADILSTDLDVASIGTSVASDALVIGFRAPSGNAVYLAFDRRDGESPQLRGVGSTSLQAPAILEGGEAMILPGPTTFQPIS